MRRSKILSAIALCGLQRRAWDEASGTLCAGAPRCDDRGVEPARSGAPLADDLGIGLSTLTRWRGKHIEADLLSGPHDDVEKELARLRKENNLLRQERDLLKKATAFFARESR